MCHEENINLNEIVQDKLDTILNDPDYLLDNINIQQILTAKIRDQDLQLTRTYHNLMNEIRRLDMKNDELVTKMNEMGSNLRLFLRKVNASLLELENKIHDSKK